MKIRERERGFAMLFVVLAIFVLVPLSLLVVRKTMSMNHLFWRNRVGAAARRLSDNLIMDYMSQFAKGSAYYENHFSPGTLQRTKTFFEAGFSSVNIQISTSARTVEINATGDYGRDPSSPKSTKSLQALFYFVPLIGQYAIQTNGGMEFAITGMTIEGPVRMDGDILVTVPHVTFNDTAIARNNISALGSTVFKSQVFYGNSFSPAYTPAIYQGGPPILGTPPGGSFQIDRDFYRVNSTTQSLNVNTAWDFRDNGGIAQYRSRFDMNNNYTWDASENWGAWTNIPPGGGIFYVENAKTYLSGTVSARVTIVCSAPPATVTVPGDSPGIIQITGSFGYPAPGSAPQSMASNNQSLFVMASYGILFYLPAGTPPGDILRISGAYYIADAAYDDPAAWCPGVDGTSIGIEGSGAPSSHFFNFLGSWNNMGTCSHFFNPPTISFDPNLQRFPAPGVPERPVLVRWRRR